MFNEGRLALIQRTGYENSSRSHFEGTDIWSTANPLSRRGRAGSGDISTRFHRQSIRCSAGTPAPNCRTRCLSRLVAVPSITNPAAYAFTSPNGAAEAELERAAAARMSSHLPLHRPHLAFVNASMQSALATLDRVATVGAYEPAVTYPNNGFGLALRAVAGALVGADRHADLLGADGRIRHARGAGRHIRRP